eukprot:360591-Chlamydomonas_euryale.AAC.2
MASSCTARMDACSDGCVDVWSRMRDKAGSALTGPSSRAKGQAAVPVWLRLQCAAMGGTAC